MRSRGFYSRNARPALRGTRCEATHLEWHSTNWMLLGVMVLALVAALVLVPLARAQDAGSLEGQVVNGTEGGAEIGAGVTVNLYVFGGNLEEQILSTETDDDGRFLFEGLDTSATLEYWVEATFQGVSYGTEDLLQFADGQTTLETTVIAHETTEDDSDVRLDLVHIFAESFGEVLRISETHLFGSTGDRTYIGEENAEGQPETVFIPLAADAVGFALGEGIPEERFVDADGGLRDSEPVRPGTLMSEVRFSYHLLATGKPITLERRFAYPVTNLTVLVAQPGLSLTSGQVQSMGSQLIQDRQYEVFSGQSLEPDALVELVFTPMAGVGDSTGTGGMPGGEIPSSGSAGGSQSLLLWIGFGLALVTVAGAVVYAATTRSTTASWTSDSGLASNPKARSLLADLADLEDAFEEGEVDEASYERQRAEIYAELKNL
jgi:5-hydroxyisourate hydrolase-like protein (transthyretin family)